VIRQENGVWKQIGHRADLLSSLVTAAGDEGRAEDVQQTLDQPQGNFPARQTGRERHGGIKMQGCTRSLAGSRQAAIFPLMATANVPPRVAVPSQAFQANHDRTIECN
jgi:hypothetical protein